MKQNIHPAIDALKEEIHRHGLTYEDVAKQAAMSLTHLKNLMSGRAKLNVEDRDAICKALDVDPQDVFRQRKNHQERNFFIDIRHLPANLQDAVRLIIDALTPQTQLTQRRKRHVTRK